MNARGHLKVPEHRGGAGNVLMRSVGIFSSCPELAFSRAGYSPEH
jgi:hypothetical protein